MKPKIIFTPHCIERAKSRGLIKYIKKNKFFYDAKFVDATHAVLDNCCYAFIKKKNKIVVMTVYENPYSSYLPLPKIIN